MLIGVLFKYAAESAWCSMGLRRLREPAENALLAACRYGLVRLLIGRVMMFLIEGSLVGQPEWRTYLLVLLPLRWLAWSLVAELIQVRRIRASGLLAGDRLSNLWRLGGSLLSCVADLPFLVAGVWAGHFWP